MCHSQISHHGQGGSYAHQLGLRHIVDPERRMGRKWTPLEAYGLQAAGVKFSGNFKTAKTPWVYRFKLIPSNSIHFSVASKIFWKGVRVILITEAPSKLSDGIRSAVSPYSGSLNSSSLFLQICTPPCHHRGQPGKGVVYGRWRKGRSQTHTVVMATNCNSDNFKK